MNDQITPNRKSSMHPLFIIAAIAVVLFCGVGTAAIMGWLPSSLGKTASADNNGVASTDQGKNSDPTMRQEHEPSHHKAVASNNNAEQRYSPPARACQECGVVESVREIDTRGQGTGLGAAGGAVVGGLAGNQVGGGRGREIATIAGVVGGALVGNKIEGNMKTTHSYDIDVRMSDGAIRTIHQAEQPNWRAGDNVKIVDGSIRSNQ